MKELIIQLADGNPGALTFLMQVFDTSKDLEKAVRGTNILNKITELNIKGTDLYVLWSDLCDKDLEKVNKLCLKCPGEVLKDACSRQDYSGRELVKEYLND